MITFKREWIKPSTILFATECPANEKSFAVALAQAKQCRAKLVVLHVCNGLTRPSGHASMSNRTRSSLMRTLKPLAQHAHDLGIRCSVAIREGMEVDEILGFARERKADRIVLGAHVPGHVGRLLVGSVAESLLRKADLPVLIAGLQIRDGAYHEYLTRSVLCSVDAHRSSRTVVRFAAEVAAQYGSDLVLQRVVAPQEFERKPSNSALHVMAWDLLQMVPTKLKNKLRIVPIVSMGDPAEELLYQGRVQKADLIVIGAHDATHFAALSNGAAIYKVLAYSYCPVLTLSPVVLADYGPRSVTYSEADDRYIAGVV